SRASRVDPGWVARYRGCPRLARGGVPQPRRAVPRGREQRTPVRAESGPGYPVLVFDPAGGRLAGSRGPQPRRAVVAGGEDAGAVGAEGGGLERSGVPEAGGRRPGRGPPLGPPPLAARRAPPP